MYSKTMEMKKIEMKKYSMLGEYDGDVDKNQVKMVRKYMKVDEEGK